MKRWHLCWLGPLAFLLAVVVIIPSGEARGEDVIKTLYLRDDGSGTENDNTDLMSTTRPTQNINHTPGGQEDYDGEGSPGLTITGSFVPTNNKTYHFWELTPVFAKTFHIYGDVNVNLYVDNNGKGGQEEIHVELFYTDRANEQLIASTDRTFYCDSISASSQPVSGFQRVGVSFSSINATIPTGYRMVLNVTAVNPPSNKLWFAYDTIEHPSHINITTAVVTDITEQTIWDMIYWPWSLSLLVPVGVLAFVLLAKKKSAIIDEVFLVHKNGNLLAHTTRRLKPDSDEDIIAAMLTAIQEFVKHSFKDERKWALHRLSFGEQEIVIERGENVFLALVHSGVNVKAIIPKMRKVVEEIEKEYKEVLKDWAGDFNELRGVKDNIETIFK